MRSLASFVGVIGFVVVVLYFATGMYISGTAEAAKAPKPGSTLGQIEQGRKALAAELDKIGKSK